MALVKFYAGSDEDLENKEFEEGAIYYVFPNSNMLVGRIYTDIDGVRREISAAYNDVALTDRIYALEQAIYSHCTGLAFTSEDFTCWIGAPVGLSAMVMPLGVTDEIQWSVSDNTIAEITNTSFNRVSGEATAAVNGLKAGTCNITVSCGEYSDTISCRVKDPTLVVTYNLANDYSPNGQSFSWSLPNDFNFEDGQYIEAAIDLTSVTTVKQNLFSIGTRIDNYQLGPVINFYSSEKDTNLQSKLRIGAASEGGSYKFTGLEIDIADFTNVIIRFDSLGCSVDGTLLRGTNANQNNTLDEIFAQLLNATDPILVGSVEGTARSTAYYDYIKYVRYEDNN